MSASPPATPSTRGCAAQQGLQRPRREEDRADDQDLIGVPRAQQFPEEGEPLRPSLRQLFQQEVERVQACPLGLLGVHSAPFRRAWPAYRSDLGRDALGKPHRAKTLYDKIWDAHLVHEAEDGTCLLYIDRHLVHEVTSPQAFEGLRMAGRTVRAPDKTIAVPDHNVPTTAGATIPTRCRGQPHSGRSARQERQGFRHHYYPVTMCGRGSCISSGPNRAGPCRA
jgi:hypothetical protein